MPAAIDTRCCRSLRQRASSRRRSLGSPLGGRELSGQDGRGPLGDELALAAVRRPVLGGPELQLWLEGDVPPVTIFLPQLAAGDTSRSGRCRGIVMSHGGASFRGLVAQASAGVEAPAGAALPYDTTHGCLLTSSDVD